MSTSVTTPTQDFGEGVLYLEQYRPWFWQVLILAFPIIPLFWNYHVKITEDEISFGYSSMITSKRANRNAVKQAVPLFDQKWGGWGIHYRPDWSSFSTNGRLERLYIAKNGGAVKVTLDEAGNGDTTTFFFSSENPQKVSDILNGKIPAVSTSSCDGLDETSASSS